MSIETTGTVTPDTIKDALLSLLDMNKAEDIETIALAEQSSSLADYMIIASGRSSRQVIALADKIIERLHHYGIGNIKKEGMSTGDWVVLDAGDIIIHLFRPEVREFYKIEKMWRDPFIVSRVPPQTSTSA